MTVELAPATSEVVVVARRRSWSALRLVASLVYVAVFVHNYRTKGFPFDRERILLWIVTALGIACLGGSWRRAVRIVVDWVPFAALLAFYQVSRGLATDSPFPLQVQGPLNVEKALFLGHVPSVALQHRLYRATASLAWWELPVSIVYASHFVLPLAVPAVLWWRNREQWKAWVLRFVVLSTAGLVTYVVLPTAPPWMVADRGLVPSLDRPIGRGWGTIHLTAAGQLLDFGRAGVNPVAAVPSLHAAFALFAVVFFWPQVKSRVARLALLAYPLAMAFVLVYGAEHYVTDILVGWLYVWGAFAVARRIDARRGDRVGRGTAR